MYQRHYTYLMRSLLSLGIILLCAAVAQAATVGSPASITVPATDPDGAYTVTWGASANAGVTYVLQEATNAGFTTGVRKAYYGPKTSVAIATRKTGTMYYYRVMATKYGFTKSAYVTAGNPCEVLLAAPAVITVPTSNVNGDYSVKWSRSASAGVTYVLEEATNAAFTNNLGTAYTGTGLNVAFAAGRAPATKYFYRVKVTKAGLADSAWTTAGNSCLILTACAQPASINVPATDADGNFQVSWGASATAGARYALQEATDADFTTNLRTAYSGSNLSAPITRPVNKSYFYRVRATKSGLSASAWRESANNCVVGTVKGDAITIDSITVAKNAGDPTLAEATFTVAYSSGAPVTGLTIDNFRFYMSSLIPGQNGEADDWQQLVTERKSSGYVYGPLVNNGGGSYTYTFATAFPVAEPAASAVQRLSIRISGSNTSGLTSSQILAVNGFHDFLIAAPATAVAAGRDIVTTAACNSCHGERIGNVGHGGGYNQTKMCVNCHNPLYETMVADRTDFTTMIHQIHAAIDGTALVPASEFNWAEITYPQDIKNCAKCHKGTAGDNWKTKPTILACGSCHTAVDFATGTGHTGGAQANNAFCAFCHKADDITANHMTEVKTPNNPQTPTGAAEFTYIINSAVVDEATGIATVNFSILKDGTPMNLSAPVTGFTGGPSFLLAYALPQDGIAAPADYNNLGKNAAQPDSVAVKDLIGTPNLVAGAKAGTYNAILAAKPFPLGATLRAVALQGYFTQVSPAVARHTQGVVKAVTGDTVRRAVVDQAKCLECHEIIEGHGGNRVNDPQLCVFCHVPNLSSSGRTFVTPYTGTNADTLNSITLFGADAKVWPEASNNFKDMIHGIHGKEARDPSKPYQFVRVRSGAAYGFDWSEVTFPGNPGRCVTCHKPGTYQYPLDANVLSSNNQTATDGTLPADVTTARLGANLPGANNLVISANTASCIFCHNSPAAEQHMTDMGSSINVPRSAGLGYEPCASCHGPKMWKDVNLVHAN